MAERLLAAGRVKLDLARGALEAKETMFRAVQTEPQSRNSRSPNP